MHDSIRHVQNVLQDAGTCCTGLSDAGNLWEGIWQSIQQGKDTSHTTSVKEAAFLGGSTKELGGGVEAAGAEEAVFLWDAAEGGFLAC